MSGGVYANGIQFDATGTVSGGTINLLSGILATPTITVNATGGTINSILAGYEARRHGYDEALLLDVNGYVAEGSGENFFIVRDGEVRTPPVTSCLPGITRASVVRILRDAGVVVAEQLFPRDAVYIADEAFMTGTAAEVTPVRELDDRTIGDGKPGPITRQLRERYQVLTRQ